MACCYLSPTLNFLMIITIGIPLNQYVYFAITGFAPMTVAFFITAIIDLMNINPKNKKIILILNWFLCIISITTFYYFLLTDITLIGTFINPYVISFSLFTQLYIIISLITFISTGLLFAISCFKSDNPEIKLKAKLLMVAFISFAIGAILSNFVLDILIIAIGMMVLAVSAIEFYMGYILPDWTKKLLLKNK